MRKPIWRCATGIPPRRTAGPRLRPSCWRPSALDSSLASWQRFALLGARTGCGAAVSGFSFLSILFALPSLERVAVATFITPVRRTLKLNQTASLKTNQTVSAESSRSASFLVQPDRNDRQESYMMTPNMNAYESILNRLEHKSAVLFLGAGSTVACKKSSGAGGLSGWGLAKEILAELYGTYSALPLRDDQIPSLTEASEYFQANHPGARAALDVFIQHRLQGLMPTIGHRLAVAFPWRAVVTTNYNTVAEDTWKEGAVNGYCAKEAITIRVDAEIDEFAGETSKLRIYKPHGCLNVQHLPNSRMVLTSQDYAESEGLRKGIYAAISSLAANNTTVFVGYSLGDYTFRNMYYWLTAKLGSWQHHSFSVAPYESDLLLEWKSKSMASLKTTLINETFDAFMLKLVKARGSLHPFLRDMIVRQWIDIQTTNKPYLDHLSVSDFAGLPA